MTSSHQTLYELLKNSADRDPSHTAVVHPYPHVSWTYAALLNTVHALANTISHHLGQLESDKAVHHVALVAPNGFPCLASFLAITSARAVAMPLNPALALNEFLFFLEDVSASALIFLQQEDGEEEDSHASCRAATQLGVPIWKLSPSSMELQVPSSSAAEPPAAGETSLSLPPQPQDPAMVLHTSGTTGRPKAVPLTHLNLCTSAANIAGTYHLAPQDTALVVMPLFHVHGLIGVALSTLSTGGTLVIPPRFSASQFWETAAKHHVTWYSAVPTIHQVLLQCAQQKQQEGSEHHLRFIRSCSSSLAPSILKKLEQTFEAPVLEAYGMTEASHQMASNPLPEEGEHRAGTVGRPTRGVEVAILDEEGKVHGPDDAGVVGEVVIRGKNVTLGYVNNPSANASSFTKEGWFRTGDQGLFQEGGYLQLTGRLKELINRGGEKISPVELDSVLLSHPSISVAVAFGVPDPKYGEEVNAAVVPKKSDGEQEELTEEEVVRHCKTQLAEFKVPKRVFVVESLPQSATGKLQRKAIASHFLSLIQH
ncbi:AMP-dependent synthetase [Balamuthia mandrillaris]